MLNKPLLAATLELPDQINFQIGWVVSPKLDGIRCLIVDGVAMSRNLKPIRNKHVQKLFGKEEYNGLDGELIVGEPTSSTCYNDTNSGVMSADGTPDVRFYVFDRYDMDDVGFVNRYHNLPVTNEEQRIVRVPHVVISTKEMFLSLEEKFIEQGYEGVMLRTLDAVYKQNRSTLREGYLLKFKRFTDSEAVIIAVEELMSNQNEAKVSNTGNTERSSAKAGLVPMDTLGSLIVRDVTSGVEFKIGSGFTAADRASFWKTRGDLVGKFVKYKSFPIGVKDKPRFPIFIGFRSQEDM